jgi:iron-sulfur cluster repair protein YtfE (RIC family)
MAANPLTDEIELEHRSLLRGVEEIREAGDLVGESGRDDWGRRVIGALQFLERDLIPHARREEEVLYPAVATILGGADATRTMSRDHAEVVELTRQLARAMEESDARMVRRLLYGLHHILRLHFAKEEEVYLPLLEGRLGREQAEKLRAALHAR